MKLFARLTDLPDNHPDIAADIQKRYSSTYINYKGQAAFVHNVRGSGVPIQLINGTEYNLNLNADDSQDVNLITPKTGYYNVGGNPVYVTKSPERQWKRSFGKHIYRIYSPLYGKELVASPALWFNTAQEIIKPEYAKLSDIKNTLFANVAVNRNFVVVSINKIPYLGYKRYPVAELDFNFKRMRLLQSPLKQEILDLLKRTGDLQWDLR